MLLLNLCVILFYSLRRGAPPEDHWTGACRVPVLGLEPVSVC